MKGPLLNAQHISAGYGAHDVLKSVSLHVYAGEIVSIIGANGAGKTTILKCLVGLHAVHTGVISFEGTDISSLRADQLVGRGLALVPEGRRIFPRLTVQENLALGGVSRKDRIGWKEELPKLFALFPVLKERLTQLGGTLSGGEQQMLAIARALMAKPALLLLDEPSMGVAPLLVTRIFEALQQLNRDGLTILLVEQNAHKALGVSNRSYVLEQGSVALEGDSVLLKHHPTVRSAYLGG